MIQCGGLRAPGRVIVKKTRLPGLPATCVVSLKAQNESGMKVSEGLRPLSVGLRTSRCARTGPCVGVGRLRSGEGGHVHDIVSGVLGFSGETWEMIGGTSLNVYLTVLGLIVGLRVTKIMQKPLRKVWCVYRWCSGEWYSDQ